MAEIYRRELREKWADMHAKYPEEYPAQFPLDQEEVVEGEDEQQLATATPLGEEQSLFGGPQEKEEEDGDGKKGKSPEDLRKEDGDFQDELVNYMDALGSKNFFTFMNDDLGFEKSHQIPREERAEVLRKFRVEVDKKNE